MRELMGKRGVKGITALVVIVAGLLAFVSSAAAASPSMVINEVYAPQGGDPTAQWVELYNRSTTALVLDGWKMRTAQNEYPLPSVTISPTSYLLVTFSRAGFSKQFTAPAGAVIADLGQTSNTLNPNADMLELVSPSGLIVDEMNWGQPSQSWKNYNSGLWNPGLTPLSDGQKSIGRTWTTEGKDTDSPSDFTLHDPYSPGARIKPAPDPSDLLGAPTDVMSWGAGLLLWLGFIMAAFIARRFQTLSGQRTYWQALLIAPSGIVIYTIIQGLAFSQGRPMNDSEKWTGFPILFLSAVLCFYVVIIFSNIAKRYLEASK